MKSSRSKIAHISGVSRRLNFGQQSTVKTAACLVRLNSDETAPPALVFARTVWGDRAGDRKRSEEGADLDEVIWNTNQWS